MLSALLIAAILSQVAHDSQTPRAATPAYDDRTAADKFTAYDAPRWPVGPVFAFTPEVDGVILAGASTSVRATTATNITESGGAFTLVKGVLANVMRVVEHPTLGTGFWVEDAATNFMLHSEDLSDVAWTKTNGSIDGNAITAPDGTSCTTCDFVSDSGTSGQLISQATGAGGRAVSVFAMAGAYDFVTIRPIGSNAVWQNFDLTDCTLGVSFGSGLVAGAEDWGNGWCRIFAAQSSGTTTPAIYVMDADDTSLTSSTGDNVAVSVYMWGLSLEAGTQPSSYIPTTSAAVTRNADVLIYQPGTVDLAVGSMVVQASFLTDDSSLATLSDGTTGNRHGLFGEITNAPRYTLIDGAVSQASINGTTDIVDGARHTVAGTWQTNEVMLYVDGVQEGSTDVVATMPSGLTNVNVGSSSTSLFQPDGVIHSLKIFDRTGATQ